MSIKFIYVTCRDKAEAKKIGRILIEEKLAACVNIIGSVDSIYEWHGNIEQQEESVLIAKTPSKLVEKLTERIYSLHSYECPCVVALPIEGGNPQFIDWVKNCGK